MTALTDPRPTPTLPVLDAAQARVLGCLVEKQATTPDVYPLTVNAALSAANQKTAREPLMALEQGVVHRALRELESLGLARQQFSSRAERYEHRLDGFFTLTRQQTALLTVINMAASVVAISHDHYLNIRQHGAVESPQLQADAGLLCIAIANLLDNAVKYSPPGEIAIDIHSDAGQTELRIRDHGPGLPAGQAELIFERYRRGEHTSPVPGGTGLGLYVARQIVQAHDGKLWLAEHGPDGCTFILTLPTVA